MHTINFTYILFIYKRLIKYRRREGGYDLTSLGREPNGEYHATPNYYQLVSPVELFVFFSPHSGKPGSACRKQKSHPPSGGW